MIDHETDLPDDEDALLHDHSFRTCPACQEPVHVVTSRADALARWVCLSCRTTGHMPTTGLAPTWVVRRQPASG